MQLIKLALLNLYILMESCLKKDMLSQVKSIGFMQMSCVKKVKRRNLFQEEPPQMTADKESLETVGLCLLFL
jgi:hypothetical protein